MIWYCIKEDKTDCLLQSSDDLLIFGLCAHVVDRALFAIAAVVASQTVSVEKEEQGTKHEEHEENAEEKEDTGLLHGTGILTHQVGVRHRFKLMASQVGWSSTPVI